MEPQKIYVLQRNFYVYGVVTDPEVALAWMADKNAKDGYVVSTRILDVVEPRPY
jgi:hypothetical protein